MSAAVPTVHGSASHRLACADQALYMAKRLGRDRTHAVVDWHRAARETEAA